MQTITCKVPLGEPSNRKAMLMEQASKEFALACTWYTEKMEVLPQLSKKALHQLYPEACSLFNLARSSLQCAGLSAMGVYRAYKSNKRKGKASYPSFNNGHLTLRQDAFKIIKTDNVLPYIIKFPTLRRGSQVILPLKPDAYHTNQIEDLLNGRCRRGSAILIKKEGRWYLLLTLVYSTNGSKPSNILGVDLGVVNLAVLSNNKFFSGKAVRARKERLVKLRSILQEKGRLSRVKRHEGRDRRWMSHINHILSKFIVAQAREMGAVIALENLEGLRHRCHATKRFNRMISSWAFRELRDFIEYKATLAGIPVILIDPRGSSITCSRCGNKGRRLTTALFNCPECNLTINADLNASRVLCQRGISLLAGETETPLWPEPERVSAKLSSIL